MTPDARPHNDDAERLELLESRLQAERPVPAPGFRGELRRHLLSQAQRPAPARLRVLIAAYGGTGALLLVVAAIGVAGSGPLAA